MSLSEKLIVAAKKGNVREVRKLLGRGALFTKDQYGNTALHEAAWNGNKDIVKALLGAFCFVDSINHTGFTPLHLASQNGHAKVVKTLLKWRADPSLMNQHGETALHLVAKYNHPSVIGAFGAFKVPMDIRGKDGNTALHISATLGNVEVTKSLLQHGADPTITNLKGLRPLDFAESGNYRDCSKLLQTAVLKWKPKSKKEQASNKYTDTALLPTEIQRAATYSFQQSSPAPAVKATKVRLAKSKGTPKQQNFFKDKRFKSGYFSEDDSYKVEVEGHPKFQTTQEVPNGFSYGVGRGEGLGPGEEPAVRWDSSPAQSKSASIDQLLTEMEREYLGQNYRHTASQPQEQASNGLITPYAEIRQFELMSATEDAPTGPHARTYRSFSQDDTMSYDFLKPSPPRARQAYDSLELSSDGGSNGTRFQLSHTPKNTHFHHQRNNNSSGSYSQVSGSPHRQQKNQVLSRPSKSPSASPGKSPAKSHQSLSKFPTRQEVLRAMEGAGPGEDMDTYVYMAPLSDFPEAAEQLGAGRGRKETETEGETGSDVSLQLQDEASSATGSESGSKNSKKAVICNSPLEADRRHEPNSGLEPVKGILSQSTASTEADKSQLEQYLQEELETMRQAFQIRLGQLERRYQRQLVMEQQRRHLQQQNHTPSSSSSSSSAGGQGVHMRHHPHPPRRRSSHLSNASQRRNSWHSYISSEQELDKLAQPDEPRSGSSMGIDSDHSVEGSDMEDCWEGAGQGEESREASPASRLPKPQGKKSVTIVDAVQSPQSTNELPESSLRGQSSTAGKRNNEPIYSTPRKQPKEGLKGGAASWKEEESEQLQESPQLSPVSSELSKEESSGIDDSAKELIQRKMEEYRAKMTKYFQEKSEAQICVLEEKYQKQIDEVKRKYDDAASEKLSHLTTRIKDLENMLDVQTLV